MCPSAHLSQVHRTFHSGIKSTQVRAALPLHRIKPTFLVLPAPLHNPRRNLINTAIESAMQETQRLPLASHAKKILEQCAGVGGAPNSRPEGGRLENNMDSTRERIGNGHFARLHVPRQYAVEASCRAR